jgi:hypothetical protein
VDFLWKFLWKFCGVAAALVHANSLRRFGSYGLRSARPLGELANGRARQWAGKRVDQVRFELRRIGLCEVGAKHRLALNLPSTRRACFCFGSKYTVRKGDGGANDLEGHGIHRCR